MADAPSPLGDAHNFGRRVERRGDRVYKPRTVAWERLLLGADSPLRRLLDEAAAADGLGGEAFGFLPRLAFFPSPEPHGGEVERVVLAPLPDPGAEERLALARIAGRSIALFSWLGIADLHWENLVLGAGADGRVVFAPLDVEMILDDFALPTATKLLPDPDPEVAAVCRHAAGVRRLLPFLGKPMAPGDLVAAAAAYLGALDLLDRRAAEIAEVLARLPDLSEAPIRVCLRGTDEYVRARSEPIWPPLLDAEAEQLARGDIPYFFRLYGRPGIHYFTDPSLRATGSLPPSGGRPPARAAAPGRPRAPLPVPPEAEGRGLFTLLGAFDHPSIRDRVTADGLSIAFGRRALEVTLPDGEALEGPPRPLRVRWQRLLALHLRRGPNRLRPLHDDLLLAFQARGCAFARARAGPPW